MKKKLLIFAGLLAVLAMAVLLTWKSFYITRVLFWNHVSIEDYQIFPERKMDAAPREYIFPKDTTLLDLRALNNGFKERFGFKNVENFEQLLTATESTAFIVIRNDTIIYENYFSGYDRSSINTSFSTSKSIASALVGIAVQEGSIKSIDDSICDYIDELKKKGERHCAITIRHLLTMTSGIAYNTESEVFGDEARAYYEPDLQSYALAFEVEEQPGNTFEYNNINPLLIGIILERSTGKKVTHYLEEKIWHSIGAEFPGSWSLDHYGFEKMESGINARAIDFLKFGKLFLDNGKWEGKTIVSADYVKESTSFPEDTVLHNVVKERSYKYYWWIPSQDAESNDYFAEGNLGQFIYVSPSANIVIVRHGKKYGYGNWPEFFNNFSTVLSTM